MFVTDGTETMVVEFGVEPWMHGAVHRISQVGWAVSRCDNFSETRAEPLSVQQANITIQDAFCLVDLFADAMVNRCRKLNLEHEHQAVGNRKFDHSLYRTFFCAFVCTI